MTNYEQREAYPRLPDPRWFLPLAAAIIIAVSLVVIAAAKAEELTASYYTYDSCRREGTSGVWTASGERFDENDLTCALRSRDFGGYYKITNLDNGKSVIVRHNYFGPNKELHSKGRVVDLSKGAFARIANLKQGIIRIKIEKIK